jgi:hypothetical protein
MDTMLSTLIETMLPKEIYFHFEVVSLSEESHGYRMRLDEYAELLPAALHQESSVVLDGFCHPIELLHFSIKGKPLYLKLYRRRWKVSCSNTHYSNHYDLHPEGVKATHEFASFLKGEAGCTADQYVSFLVGTKY